MSLPKHLNIGIAMGLESVKINATHRERRMHIYDCGIRLTEVFAEKLGFSFSVKTSRDREMGRRLPNGTWTGLMGMLLQGEIDAAIYALSISEERQKVVDFSYPFAVSRVTFATRNPEYAPDMTTFLKPFSLTVWGSIAIIFLFMTIMFYLIFQKQHPVKDVIFNLYCSIINQSMKLNPRKPNEYVLLLFWKLSAMVLGYSYTGALLSFLTFPNLDGVSTIPELASAVSKGKYACTTAPGTIYPFALLNSVDSNSKIIGECLQRNKGSYGVSEVLDDRSSNIRPSYIYAEVVLEPYGWRHFVSEDTFFFSMAAIAFRKDFCCKSHFDEIINYMWAGGVFQKLLRDFNFKKALQYPPNSFDILERPLTMDDLMGVFILLITGYVFSISVLVFEIIFNKSHIVLNLCRSHT